jgi:cytochrome c oxidase subunit 2
VNKPVRFEITSADVIHSFWVPQFRGKRDATPGRISEFVITPTKLGEFPVRCAELCGPGHANMTTKVIVQTQSEFDAWLMESQ